MILTTSYTKVIEDIEKEKSSSDTSLMHIVIPMKHITQIRYFDEDMYEKFRAQKEDEDAAY